MVDQITPMWLRSIGFRICSTDADNQPHMFWMYDSRQEVGVEVSRSTANKNAWTCWLRSYIPHTRCRFCFIRTVERQYEMLELLRGVSGQTPAENDIDELQFAESWERESVECERRYREYARHERWGRVPG